MLTTVGPDWFEPATDFRDFELPNSVEPDYLGIHLTPPPVAVKVVPSMDPGPPRLVRLSPKHPADISKVQYRVDSGAWKTYRRPFLVTGGGEHVVRYRTINDNGRASAIKSVSFTVWKRR